MTAAGPSTALRLSVAGMQGRTLGDWAAGRALLQLRGWGAAWTLLLASACTPPAAPVLPLQPEDFTLRGVPADLDSAELRLTFGDPDTVLQSPNPFVDSIPLITWIYDGFEVRYAGQSSPTGYMITEAGESTARGLAVGSPVRRMLELYGDPTTRFEASWTYTDTTDADVLRVLNALVQSDTVRRIYIGWALE